MLSAQARCLLLGGERVTLADAGPSGKRGLALALACQRLTGECERVELAGHAGDDARKLRARLSPGDQRLVVELRREPVRDRVLALLGSRSEQHTGVPRRLRFRAGSGPLRLPEPLASAPICLIPGRFPSRPGSCQVPITLAAALR